MNLFGILNSFVSDLKLPQILLAKVVLLLNSGRNHRTSPKINIMKVRGRRGFLRNAPNLTGALSEARLERLMEKQRSGGPVLVPLAPGGHRGNHL